MTVADPMLVTSWTDGAGRRHKMRRGAPDRLVEAGGRLILPVRVDWHARPIRVHDVGIDVACADGVTRHASTVAFDRVAHADGQTAVAFRDVFGMSDSTFSTAADLRHAVGLADELLRCRRAYNVDRLL